MAESTRAVTPRINNQESQLVDRAVEILKRDSPELTVNKFFKVAGLEKARRIVDSHAMAVQFNQKRKQP